MKPPCSQSAEELPCRLWHCCMAMLVCLLVWKGCQWHMLAAAGARCSVGSGGRLITSLLVTCSLSLLLMCPAEPT